MIRLMFSGIIHHVGRVCERRETPSGLRLVIESSGWGRRIDLGESIAVNGCCLTVAEIGAGPESFIRVSFDVIPQTLRMTTLGELRTDSRVNLEGSVTADTLLSGHIVQGHVDATGDVGEILQKQGEHRVRINTAREYMELVVDKGSIAVNGVSLTVAETGPDWFEVALIPTTLRLTTLGELKTGMRVNLESDCLARMVVNFLKRSEIGKAGFVR
ncbi:MAG TPA: riboflavin synthase [Phycisphaerales bacterium]|nr:riboflavin synthase [Phycisphaerales bacterium]